MFPAFPTGRTWQSGASPRASQISKAAVFCPSMRYGLTELTRVTGNLSEISRTRRSASSKFPRIWMTWAPWIIAWESLPRAIFPSGMRTNAFIPALAA